ncbi:MAG: alkaline phosphatase family protein, partial [Candidatus Baltobacteraceae bacterium]
MSLSLVAASGLAACSGGSQSSAALPSIPNVPVAAAVDSPTDIAPLSSTQVTSVARATSAISTQGFATTFGPSGQNVATNLFYTMGGEAGTVAAQMGVPNTLSKADVSVTAPPAPYVDSWGWVAQQAQGTTTWPAATYNVTLDVTQPNSNLSVVGVKIYRVDADNGGGQYVGLSLVAVAMKLSVSLGSVGAKTFKVDGVAQSASPTDKIAVKFYTVSLSDRPESFAYAGGAGALSKVSITPAGAPTPDPSPSAGPTALPISTPTPTPVPTPSARPTASPTAVPTPPVATPTPPAVSGAPIGHITVVMMENLDYEKIIGNSQAPYVNSLASQNALLTDSHGVTHPSEPNYLAFFSGSTQGITDDSCPHTFSGPNLASELIAKGDSFAGYSENLPANGTDCQGSPDSLMSGYLYERK